MDYKKEVPMGQIRTQSILDFYQTEHYNKVKDLVLGNTESPPEFICKCCISPGG